MLSEVLYFLEASEIASLAETIDACAAPAYRIVSVNWLGGTAKTLDGRKAADLFAHHLRHWSRARHCFPAYLMDVFDAPGRACAKCCGARTCGS